MNRFKKWIIHKLGGYCIDDVRPTNIVTTSFPIKTFCCKHSVNRYANSPIPPINIEEILYRQLAYELQKNKVGQYSSEFNSYTGCIDYRLSIDIVDRGNL